MSSALIIGDGPGGLSAALYLAKNEIQTTVFGQNETPMHYAMLYNYLGIPEMTGTEFQEVARQQITGFGANLVETQVKTVTKNDDGFSVMTSEDDHYSGKYLIISTLKTGPATNQDQQGLAVLTFLHGKFLINYLL